MTDYPIDDLPTVSLPHDDLSFEAIGVVCPAPRNVVITQFAASVMNGGEEEKIFLATLAVDEDTRHIMGVDVLEGAQFTDGQLNCRSKLVTEYKAGPLASTKYCRGMAALRIHCDMTPAMRFIMLVQQHGDKVADMSGCDIQLIGCVERYRLHAQHLITTNAEMPAEELNRLLLTELRQFWFARWGFDKIPDYFQRRIKIAAAMERAAAECSFLVRKIASERRAKQALVNLKPFAAEAAAQRNAFRQILKNVSRYRQRGSQRMPKNVVFMNPFQDRSVFLLIEGEKSYVEVKRGSKVTIPLPMNGEKSEPSGKRRPKKVTIQIPTVPDEDLGAQKKPSKLQRRFRSVQAANAV